MMTLDEAIKHAEEVAEEKRYEYQECLAVHDTKDAMVCVKCGEEHEQLAEWLKDYKRLKEQEPILDKIRAEIEQNAYPIVHGYNYDVGMTLYGILRIIDKYKVEMRGNEE